MSLFTAQYFKFNFCAPIFQFPLEQQIGGAFCRRPLSKTSAENFRQCSPTLDSTYHLQTHFHRLEKWSNQRWKKGAEYERMRRCGVLGKEWMVTVWREKGAEMRWIIGGTPACLHAHTITTQTHNHRTNKHKHKETKTNTAT